MRTLEGFRWYRLRSAPRQPDKPAQSDPTAGQLFAALVAAHAELLDCDGAEPAALAVAWIRPPGEEQIRFLVGGRPFFPPAGSQAAEEAAEVPVLYPPGARGVPVGDCEMARVFEGFPWWLRCLGEPDALLPATSEQDQDRSRGSFDEYVAHLGGPFAWLLIAEPLAFGAIEQELTSLSTRIPLLRRRENSESDRLQLEQAQGRYREMTRARVSGIWNVSVLMGGMEAASARRAAALLCSASDLDGLPYVLMPEARGGPFADVLLAPAETRDSGCSPFPATAELVAALARPPARELPGIRLVTPHTFDVTPEQSEIGRAHV